MTRGDCAGCGEVAWLSSCCRIEGKLREGKITAEGEEASLLLPPSAL